MTPQRIGILTILMVIGLGSNLYAAPSVTCGAAFGTKFNLEPSTRAVPQQFESVDFIPNGVGLNLDLVVGGAFDFRGAPSLLGVMGSAWDGSVSGYYVHRSTTADCKPQFEGGLPPIVSQGKTYGGDGGVSIAADAVRNAFFAADLRFDSVDGIFAIGLLRAAAADLKSTTSCPNGTHTLAQATSCWGGTAPVVLDPGSTGNLTPTLDFPIVAVDERASNAGVGAGDVYVAFQDFTTGIVLVSCTNSTLSCSAPKVISASGEPVALLGTGNPHVQVRPDGKITVTYLDSGTSVPQESIKFVLCNPAGAPKAPVCNAPTLVANENQALGPTITTSTLSGLNLLVFTSTRHADRLEADGKTVTSFVVWDRCKTYFQNPSGGLFSTCLNAQVLLSASKDDGKTWSAPVAVNASAGHQFLPAIATDESTGTVNIAYYNTGPDMFHNRAVVSLNQIAAGTTTIGATVAVTSSPEAPGADPTQDPLAINFSDFHFGVKARGMGTAGLSRVYASFTSTADRPGVYNASPLPEQNNNLQKLTY